MAPTMIQECYGNIYEDRLLYVKPYLYLTDKILLAWSRRMMGGRGTRYRCKDKQCFKKTCLQYQKTLINVESRVQRPGVGSCISEKSGGLGAPTLGGEPTALFSQWKEWNLAASHKGSMSFTLTASIWPGCHLTPEKLLGLQYLGPPSFQMLNKIEKCWSTLALQQYRKHKFKNSWPVAT